MSLTYKKVIEYTDNIQINYLQYPNKYNENEKVNYVPYIEIKLKIIVI